MKHLLIAMACICAFAACKKSSERHTIENTINGKWWYTEQYESSGGPGQWYAVTPENQFIDFQANGVINTNMQNLSDATGYQLVDSVRVKVFKPSITGGFIIYQYSIDTIAGKLTISPVAPYLCIEGCMSRFERH